MSSRKLRLGEICLKGIFKDSIKCCEPQRGKHDFQYWLCYCTSLLWCRTKLCFLTVICALTRNIHLGTSLLQNTFHILDFYIWRLANGIIKQNHRFKDSRPQTLLPMAFSCPEFMKVMEIKVLHILFNTSILFLAKIFCFEGWTPQGVNISILTGRRAMFVKGTVR